MAETAYALCALTAGLCTALLLRGYARSKFRLLLWSGICFAGLTVNSLLLVLDKIVFPGTDLSTARLLAALLALLILVAALILEE